MSAQAEATILARHAAGETLRAIAADYGVSHQALSKRIRRARARQAQELERQLRVEAEPERIAAGSSPRDRATDEGERPEPARDEPAGERGPALEERQVAGPNVSPSRCESADGLVRLRRGDEARWVDPVAESARYERLLAEGFAA